MQSTEGRARPRVGLLGNPSDLYGGAVVAFTFEDFLTRVNLEPADSLVLVPGEGAPVPVVDGLNPGDHRAGAELLAAAVRRFAAARPELGLGDGAGLRARLTFSTDVPRQAGLSGSSAIVIAALRALGRAFDVELDPFLVSELALTAEVEDLGIVAGPQDRVVQAYGGLVGMDFTRERAPASYERLDQDLLPPLILAWNEAPGRDSGATHHDVYQRWQAGDPEVVAAMEAYPDLVSRGLAALRAGDRNGLADAVDENFDRRAALFPISGSDRELVQLGRSMGAGVKFCGSGGSVLVVPRSGTGLEDLERGYRDAGYAVLRPSVTIHGGGSRPAP